MLHLWTPVSKAKTLDSLSPILKNYLNVPVTISPDFDKPDGTKIILSLGKDSLSFLQQHSLAPKNRTISSLRMNAIYVERIPIMVSYSPEIKETDPKYHTDLLTDVGIALRYCLTDSFVAEYGEYSWVDDFSDFIRDVKTQYYQTQQPVEVMLDLETLGLDPYALPTADHPGAWIITAQASFSEGKAHVVKFSSRKDEQERMAGPLKGQMNWLLNSPMVSLRGANLKYDLHWLAVRGALDCTNFKFDTTLVGSLLDENRSNALDVHVKLYAVRGAGYSDIFDRTVDKSRMDKAIEQHPQDFLRYSAGDVDFGLEVAKNMKTQLLANESLATFYVNILHPAARAFEKIEQGGVCVDIEAYKELKSDLENEQNRLINEAKKIVGGRIAAKHRDMERFGDLNLTKASLIKDYLFSPMGLNLKPKSFTEKPDRDGNKVPSTALASLLEFSDHPKAGPFVNILHEYSKVVKTYNTYVLGFLEHLRSDGRFHPTYFLFRGDKDEGEGGTTTGRLTAADPSFQTIPKHTPWAKRIRRCFTAPPGYVVVERDFSQGELRVVACVADEKNMLSAYQEGKDLHALTGAAFLRIPYEEMLKLKKEDPEKYSAARQAAKPANFGLLYGQGEQGFKTYAEKNYGVKMTDEETKERRNLFFDSYPNLLLYHNSYRKFAKKHGYVCSPLGRIRHLPLINSPNKEVAAKQERMAINSPIQGCLSDMLLWALAIEHQTGLYKTAPAFGAIHDAAYNYVPEDKIDETIAQLIEIQENLPFHKVGWEPQIQFPADAKFGANMADLEEWKRK